MKQNKKQPLKKNTVKPSRSRKQKNGVDSSVENSYLRQFTRRYSWFFWFVFILLVIQYVTTLFEDDERASGTSLVGLQLALFAFVQLMIGSVYLILHVVNIFSKYSNKQQKQLSIFGIVLAVSVFTFQLALPILFPAQKTVHEVQPLLTDVEVINLIDRCKVYSISAYDTKLTIQLNPEIDKNGAPLREEDGDPVMAIKYASSMKIDDFVAEVNKVSSRCGDKVKIYGVY